MIALLLLVIGLIVLIGGTQLTVDKSVAIAQHYKLSDFFVGIVILAFGSDLPEIMISVDAALHQFEGEDTSGVIIGNIVGSAFSQIGLIMGIIGLFGYLTLQRKQVYLHGGILLSSLLILILASLDGLVTRIEGMLLVLVFVIFVVMLYFDEVDGEQSEVSERNGQFKTWLLLVSGIALVLAGAEITVQATVTLAENWGVDQSLIAIIIIGIGSSLPELAISLAAVVEKRGGLSIGNLIGSNILDTLLPAGLAAMIYPFAVEAELVRFDMPMLLGLTLLVLIFFRRKRGLQRFEAMTLIAFYCFYLLIKILMQ